MPVGETPRNASFGWLRRFQPCPLTKASSANLDSIRALAAWLVMWGHLRNLFFVDFEDVLKRTSPVKLIYFLTGLGHQSVVVFFVLSGFLISSAILKRVNTGTWSWRGYVIDRLTRLYVVLVPGLVFGLLWDKIGATLFASTGIYSHPLPGFGPAIAQSQATFPILLGNLVFLQTLIYPVFGSNGPLWSLANEFWYYALFPTALLAGVAWANQLVRRAVFLTAIALVIGVFIRIPILPGFVIWMAGFVLVLAYTKFNLQRPLWRVIYLLISSAMVLSCLVAARTRGVNFLGSDLALGVAFCFFLFGALQMKAHYEAYSKTAHFFAGFSYSLYVLHFPFLVFLKAWLSPTQKWSPDAVHLSLAFLLGVFVLIFAWVVSVFTEQKTGIARAWMEARLARCEALRFPRKLDHPLKPPTKVQKVW